MYGVASAGKHGVLREHGATPNDYRIEDCAEVIRQRKPGGIDVAFDGMMRLETIRKTLPLLRRGGRMVCFGEPASRGDLARILGTLLQTNLKPNGKSLSLYDISSYFLFDQTRYLEDWAELYGLLEPRQLAPVIAARFPILEAAQANALLESGQVTGNVVLVAK